MFYPVNVYCESDSNACCLMMVRNVDIQQCVVLLKEDFLRQLTPFPRGDQLTKMSQMTQH